MVQISPVKIPSCFSRWGDSSPAYGFGASSPVASASDALFVGQTELTETPVAFDAHGFAGARDIHAKSARTIL